MRFTPMALACALLMRIAVPAAEAQLRPYRPIPSTPAAAPTPPGPTPPYSATVDTELLRVRCGPGHYYYSLLMLEEGTKVTVQEATRGWSAVTPPPGVYGLVRRSDVTLSPDGATATVSVPQTRVYTSSEAADRAWCVLARLPEGRTLAIAGPPRGEMVRVEPPEGSRVYVSSVYLEAESEPTPPTPPTPEVDIEVEVEMSGVQVLIEAFKATDATLVEELKKPVPDRDYTAAAAKYAEILEKTDKRYLKTAARQRIAYLGELEKQKSHYQDTVAIETRLNERLAELQARRAEEEAVVARQRSMVRPAFQAQGVVARIQMLEGVEHPVRHKLLDKEGRIVCVLKSDTYDLDRYVGRAVGVRGAKSYVKDWKTNLITVDDLEVIE